MSGARLTDARIMLDRLGVPFSSETRIECPNCRAEHALLVESNRHRPFLWCPTGCTWCEAEAVLAQLLADHEAAPARRRGPDSSADAVAIEQLREIPSAVFVPALTRREPNRQHKVQCPFHDDGQERTPSLHVSNDAPHWHCFGCTRGGDLFDFYATFHSRPVPTGREFIHFAREVATALSRGGR